MSSPKEVFRVGSVNASVFENTIVKDGKTMVIPKVVLQVRYKDKTSGEWKSTASLSLNDIPKAISALQKAYQMLTEKGAPSLPEDTSEPVD